MQALIVLDVQKGLMKRKQFERQQNNITALMKDFKNRQQVIIATQHLLPGSGSIFDPESEDSQLAEGIEKNSDLVVVKSSPNAFSSPELSEYLVKHQVDQVFVVGFNAEYCCLFTSIVASDRGYKVTYIEDASGTVNDEDTYEMKGLDIVDFVGSVLDWSDVVEVLYMEEYVEQYQ